MHQVIFRHSQIIYTVHSHHIDYHFPKGNFFKSVYAKSVVVSVSRGIQDRLRDDKGVESHVIPNPVDMVSIASKATELAINGDYIVAVGRLLNDVKQFNLLINAYATSNLPQRGVSLKILGDGPDYQNLANQISDRGLTSKVELLGFVDNPYPYIKHAKFLCLTSKFEGLPLVILEALSLKTPVVAFDCPSGSSKMIINGKNGILVEHQNTKALVDALNQLSEDNELLKKLTDTIPEVDLEPYSLNQHLQSWETLFKSL